MKITCIVANMLYFYQPLATSQGLWKPVFPTVLYSQQHTLPTTTMLSQELFLYQSVWSSWWFPAQSVTDPTAAVEMLTALTWAFDFSWSLDFTSCNTNCSDNKLVSVHWVTSAEALLPYNLLSKRPLFFNLSLGSSAVRPHLRSFLTVSSELTDSNLKHFQHISRRAVQC